jgi:hypothetical protein
MKCDNCRHKGICKYEDNMKKFDSEIRDKQKLLENNNFRVDIGCKNFDKSEINIR